MDIFGNEEYKCALCQHPGTYHFSATDSRGFYAFCLLEDCDCWLDSADDAATS